MVEERAGTSIVYPSAGEARAEGRLATMKKGIHPKYMDCTVRCGCGETWQTRSTVPEIKIEICSACHPYFKGGTGKFIDTLGRVDRFTKKFGSDYFVKATKKKPAKTARG